MLCFITNCIADGLGRHIPSNQHDAMTTRAHIHRPPEHRKSFPKIFSLALFVITGLYIFFGASGYVSFGDETEEIITLNLPPGLFPHIVKACLCFSLFFTFPDMRFFL